MMMVAQNDYIYIYIYLYISSQGPQRSLFTFSCGCGPYGISAIPAMCEHGMVQDYEAIVNVLQHTQPANNYLVWPAVFCLDAFQQLHL